MVSNSDVVDPVRQEALARAIEFHKVQDSWRDADFIVDVAETFEKFLRGESQ